MTTIAETKEPHIWTSKGHLPIADLQHFVGWDITPKCVKFREVYKTQDGEIVKDSTHVHMLEGLEASVEQATLG